MVNGVPLGRGTATVYRTLVENKMHIEGTMSREGKLYAVIIECDDNMHIQGMRVLAEVQSPDQARVLIHKAERDVKTN